MCAKIGKLCSSFGKRHIQYVMLFAAINVAYGIRAIFSIAVIPMTAADPADKNIPSYPEWLPYKNIMLSSFFWGYVCFQIGAGMLIKKYGPKWFLGGAIFIGSLSCALIPILGAQFGYVGVIVSRIITGLTQGFLFPCVHCLLSAWTAVQDRAKFGSFVYAAGPLGNVISMLVAGLISNSRYGWPAVFYLYGTLGMAWTIIWSFIGSDCPAKHKSISLKEREYIEEGVTTSAESENVPTPWLAIFKSLPFWAILISHSGQNFGFWTLLTETPSYMNNILNFDLKENGVLSALPYLVNWIFSLFISPLADYLVIKQYVSIGQSRKIFNSIGLFLPAAALLCLSFIRISNSSIAVALITMAVGFNSGVYSGYNVNHIDISPIHAGILMSITNSVSNLFSLVAPLIVDATSSVTGYKENQKELWTCVFSLASIIYIVAGVTFDVFASGEVQPWNNLENNNEDPEEAKEKKQPESIYPQFETIRLEKTDTRI